MSQPRMCAVVLALAASLWGGVPAWARKVAACAPDRWVITAPSPVLAAPNAQRTAEDVVAYEETGRRVDLQLATCTSPARARLKGTAGGTRVTAVFPRGSCLPVDGAIHLRATIGADCTTWSGFLKYPHQPKRRFDAT